MINVILFISSADLYQLVEQTTAYLGARQAPADDSGAHFDRVAALPADRPMLSRFASEALSTLSEKLRDIIAPAPSSASAPAAASSSAPAPSSASAPAASDSAQDPAEDSSGFSISLSLSNAFDQALTSSALTAFRSFMVTFVTSRWLRLVLPEKEPVWQAETQRLLNEITSTLYHRNPPKRH